MKYSIAFWFIFIVFCAFADMPGNKPRPSYDVIVEGLHQHPDYIFYSQEEDSIKVVNDSGLIHIEGGYGAPRTILFYAKNIKTKINTDTVFFESYHGVETSMMSVVVKLDNNHLYCVADSAFNNTKNQIPFASGVQSSNIESKKNQYIMYFISGLSLFIILALVFFVWNKNRKSKIIHE